jgi:uncharacterized phage-associated protein
MINKTLEFLTYIIEKYEKIPITSLMKLSYLIDLVNVKNRKSKISDFEYIRYNFGPFDNKIYDFVKQLLEKKLITQDLVSSFPEDYLAYKLNDTNKNLGYSLLDSKEKETIDEVLNSLKGLGAKDLTAIAYKTKPMVKLGAKPNNSVGLNKKLDLFTA